MEIQYASDLHLEFDVNDAFMRRNPFIPKAEILVLAGDVSYLHEPMLNNVFFEKISEQFKEVYIIPGNHEFYHKTFDVQQVIPSFQKKINKNVSYINNKAIYKEGLRILFSTLWTAVSPDRTLYINRMMNDFRQCVYGDERFEVKHHNSCHHSSRLFLERELSKPFDGKTVVVTHHVPFKSSRCKYSFGSNLSEAFHVDMERIFFDFKIDYWIYGHNHWNMKPFKINETFLCTNQLGYLERDEHKEFQRDAIIKL